MASNAGARAARGERAPAPLWKRLLLAAGSVVATMLALEVATRLFVPPPAPVRFAEGVYVSQLPLVTGRDTVPRVEGPPLPEQKRPGEVRVFVFGESSVEGAPWGYAGSPVTMLHDQLLARLPERDVTVVNMGRGAGTTLDAYYFLASIERFSPDFIVFYQGGNDFFDVDRERCMPAEHPVAYAAYRWLVERSRALWTARALGPAALARRLHRGPVAGHSGPGGFCDRDAGFRAWTRVLVRTAKAMGAEVVVTTSVESPLRRHETTSAGGGARAASLADKSDAYRRLLACALSDRCDLAEALRREQGDEHHGAAWVEPRGRAWLDAAAEAGAPAIDFAAYLAAHAEGGVRPPIFAEEFHLSLQGYGWLSWLWSQQIGALIEGGSFDARTAGPPPPLPVGRYAEAVVKGAPEGTACILLRCADNYVRANMLLMAAPLLEEALAAEGDEPASPIPAVRSGRLLLGGMRRDLGLDPALPPPLRAELDDRSLDDLARALRDVPGCHRGGGPPPGAPVRPAGPAELALLAPLSVGATLGGWKVVRIDAVRDGVIRLAVERGSDRVELQVALDGPDGPHPPALAGRYATFYTTRDGDDAEGVRLAAALAAVVEKNASAQAPPGMTQMKTGP